jgi:hypothetical protein
VVGADYFLIGVNSVTIERPAKPTLRATGISLVVVLLFSFISTQYASAVVKHKMLAPLSLEMKHPVNKLMKSRFYRGDMVNSYQRNQFSVTVLCPQDLGLLIRQVARGIHLCGLVAGLFRAISGVFSLQISWRESLISIAGGATVFGCALLAPDFIRRLTMWSLGYAPY